MLHNLVSTLEPILENTMLLARQFDTSWLNPKLNLIWLLSISMGVHTIILSFKPQIPSYPHPQFLMHGFGL